ncbi:hydroxymyristoyl-ACP dehydratase [Geotalea sp. SG265]|uniref:3-hydroxyacyl-ACP dehydratase FabZ family protein n=1 Tax=Geotalea sp. SG265 TaxID=2922867 RepID=UPI001FAF2094|nr:hydroxymyristoyl-ACP dehydratase [Geotalea sp. SG265]
MLSGSGEALLTSSDPCRYLPHRPPFLFVDKIIHRETGVSASGELVVTTDSGPFPPVLLIESMAQVSGIAAGQEAGVGGILAAISHGKLPVAVAPGTYLAQARIIKSFGTLHLVEGEVSWDGTVVASATLTLGVGNL